MRIHNLYADENGETHFRDIEIELSDTGPDGTISKIFPATGVIFRTTPHDWFFDWHATTRRQYVVNLDAPHKVTASDGEARIIGTGEIYLVEDMQTQDRWQPQRGVAKRGTRPSAPRDQRTASTYIFGVSKGPFSRRTSRRVSLG